VRARKPLALLPPTLAKMDSRVILLDVYTDARNALQLPSHTKMAFRSPPNAPYQLPVAVVDQHDHLNAELTQLVRLALEELAPLDLSLAPKGIRFVEADVSAFNFIPWVRLVERRDVPLHLPCKSLASQSGSSESLTDPSAAATPVQIFNRLCFAERQTTLRVRAPNQIADCPAAFHLPARSAFLLADMSQWHSHLLRLRACLKCCSRSGVNRSSIPLLATRHRPARPALAECLGCTVVVIRRHRHLRDFSARPGRVAASKEWGERLLDCCVGNELAKGAWPRMP
jgi:hypothetical protein